MAENIFDTYDFMIMASEHRVIFSSEFDSRWEVSCHCDFCNNIVDMLKFRTSYVRQAS